MIQCNGSVTARNSKRHKISKTLKHLGPFLKKIHLSTKCTFSGKRSETDFVERSVCLGNTKHCLPTTHGRNYCGLRQNWFAKCQNLFSRYARGKESLELFQAGWKSGYSNWSSFSTTAWFKRVHYLDSHGMYLLLAWTGVAWQAASPGRGEFHPMGCVSFYICLQADLDLPPCRRNLTETPVLAGHSHPPESTSTDKSKRNET